MQNKHNGSRYHRRCLKPTPFVLAAIMTPGFGAVIAVAHSGIGTWFGLLGLFVFLVICYLDGPTQSVTVRNGTLEVRNMIHRYEIPPSRILSIEYISNLCVLVRLEGHEPISVGAFSRNRLQWRQLSDHELRTNAKSLTDALLATAAPTNHRQLKVTYRWANVLLVAAIAIGLLSAEWVAYWR